MKLGREIEAGRAAQEPGVHFFDRGDPLAPHRLAQLEHAGLAGFFERLLSVESVGKFKPHADVYAWAAREMGVPPDQCMLVAAHGWDVAGARWAGMQAAFIARAGQQMFPLAPQPEIDVADLEALAGEISPTRRHLCA